MAITSALVLFAVIWFMTLFIVLPLRLETQADVGKVARGTPSSAPVNPQLKKRALIVTAITVVVWSIIMAVILSGVITVEDFDWFDHFTPPESR
jgi:predicted secreted protein